MTEQVTEQVTEQAAEQVAQQDRKPFLYVVVCAAGVADGIGELISLAQERTWEVGVIATPLATGFFDVAAVEARTGRPVRSAWRSPGDPRPFPDPDAVAVAPATFNTASTSGRPASPTRWPSARSARRTGWGCRSPYCPV